jgi:hypothetical protein
MFEDDEDDDLGDDLGDDEILQETGLVPSPVTGMTRRYDPVVPDVSLQPFVVILVLLGVAYLILKRTPTQRHA